MEDAMRIMEEILETEYKGLVYINETREIGSYSRCAKKITGILLDSEQRHPGGRIEEGDIVIIADNELGNDDELTPESLSQISGMTVTFGLQLTVAQQNFLNNAAYLGTMLLLVIRILTGLFADFLYFLHCKKLCCTLDRQSQTREDFLAAAARRGGVNRAVIIILIALYVLVAWSITFFIISPDILGV